MAARPAARPAPAYAPSERNATVAEGNSIRLGILGLGRTGWGTRGGLECTGNQLRLRTLDPQVQLAPCKANPGDRGETFGTPEELPWIEETILANPSHPTDIWEQLYAAVREGNHFPISLDQAVEVMKVISRARKGTAFHPKANARRQPKRSTHR